jgi:flavin-dependent dehydrogenase
MPQSDSYDCVIIGGGPAGATVGTLLAGFGHRALILERSHFPRHHIGESLMPQTYWTFKRLGMLDALKASDFPRKESVQFVSPSGDDSTPYFFTDRDAGEWSTTWQVPRDKFDQMMLDNARQHGAEVCEGASVSEVIFEGDRAVGINVSMGGSMRRMNAKVVVDATGMSALLSRQLGLREPNNRLRKAAIYGYYKGALRDKGRNAGATIIIHTADRKGWFWFIPLPGDVVSVGVVAAPAYLCSGRGDDPSVTLNEEIAACPGIKRRLENAERVSQAYVTSDYSYRAKRLAGDGWVLIGDAYGFLDPIYSAGVFLALKSGELAADTIHEALDDNDVRGEMLGAFESRLTAGMHLIEQLVHVFYDRSFSFGEFNREHPEYKDHIVRLLIGDVFNDEVGAVFEVLGRYTNLDSHSVSERRNGKGASL